MMLIFNEIEISPTKQKCPVFHFFLQSLLKYLLSSTLSFKDALNLSNSALELVVSARAIAGMLSFQPMLQVGPQFHFVQNPKMILVPCCLHLIKHAIPEARTCL